MPSVPVVARPLAAVVPTGRGRAAAPAAAAVAVAMLATSCALPAGVDGTDADGRPLVLTTFTVLADVAEQVAGDRLRVESITKQGAEIHGYEPTPGDIRRAAGADLVLDNGLGLEAWFEQFLTDTDAPRVVLSEGVAPIDIAEDAYAGRPNPHAWMSPLNVQVYADNMASAFADLDPDGAQEYRDNAAAYSEQLRQVHDDLVAELTAVPPDRRVLVTCEGAFSYLARDTGMDELYLWAVNAEQQATPQQVADVADQVAARDVPAVFCESTVSDDAMQQVAQATGASFGGTLYVDSLSAADGPVPTYLDLVRHDADTIVAGLTGGPAR